MKWQIEKEKFNFIVFYSCQIYLGAINIPAVRSSLFYFFYFLSFFFFLIAQSVNYCSILFAVTSVAG